MIDDEPFDDLMDDSDENVQSRVEAALGLGSTPTPAGSGVRSFDPTNFGGSDTSIPNLDMLMDVTLQLSVELGRTKKSVKDVLDLQKGAVVELDRMAGEAVDIYVNNHLFARGEVVVVDDKFGVRITELISPQKHGGN